MAYELTDLDNEKVDMMVAGAASCRRLSKLEWVNGFNELLTLTEERGIVLKPRDRAILEECEHRTRMELN